MCDRASCPRYVRLRLCPSWFTGQEEASPSGAEAPFDLCGDGTTEVVPSLCANMRLKSCPPYMRLSVVLSYVRLRFVLSYVRLSVVLSLCATEVVPFMVHGA